MHFLIKRKIFFIFLLMIISIAAFFHQSLISSFIDFSLQGYFRYKLNADFHAKQIYRDGDVWILEKPILDEFAPWGKRIYADRAVVDYSWTGNRLDLKLHLENGLITIVDPLHPDIRHSVRFQFDGMWDSQLRGHAIGWMETSPRTDHCFDLSFNEQEKDTDTQKFVVNLNNMDCSHISPVVHQLLPSLNPWHIEKGVLSGRIEVVVDGQGTPSMTADMVAKNLTVYNRDLYLVGKLPKVRIQLAKSMSLELLQPASCFVRRNDQLLWEANEVTGGFTWPSNQSAEIAFKGLCSHGNQTFAMNVSGQSEVQDQDVSNISHRIVLIGEYAGFQGEFVFDFDDPDQFMTLHLNGNGSNLLTMVPDVLQSRIKEMLGSNYLTIDAGISRSSFGAKAEGVLSVFAKNGNPDRILFGVDLESNCVQNGPTGPLVKGGWFQASGLDLGKYIAPFIFENNQLQLIGSTDVKGAFDRTSLILHYDAKGLSLSNTHFSIECENLRSPSNQQVGSDLPGIHYIDFTNGSHGGIISLENARYFEKNSGLLFTDISAQITLGQHCVYVNDIETYCNGVYFTGALDVDYGRSKEGWTDIGIFAQTMSGRVAEVQTLLAHFKESLFLLKLPLDGHVLLRQGGGYLNFGIQPDGVHVQAHIQGALSEGVLAFQDLNLAFHDLSTNFDYNHHENTLSFSDIQGTLLVGPPDHVEEYAVAGEHVRFVDYEKNQAEFDVWVGDKNRDIMRIVGKTGTLGNSSKIDFILNHQLSHFGDVHPDVFQLVMKDWTQVESLKVQFGFRLGTLLRDLQRFSRTGLLFLSRSLLSELNDLKTAEGDFKVNIGYDRQTTHLTYDVSSHDSAIGRYSFKECLLQGKNKGTTWTIDQLKLDDLSFAAEVTSKDTGWDVNFLGVTCGKSLLMGLEGEYFTESNALDAQVNLLEVNLEHLNELTILSSFAEQCPLKGQLRGAGKMRFELGKGKPGWRVETQLETTLKNTVVQGIKLQDAQNFFCNFVSDRCVTLRHIKSAIKDDHKDEVLASFEIDTINYDFSSHDVVLDGLHFQVPVKNLPWAAARLKQYLPGVINDPVVEMIVQAKSSGQLEGVLALTASSEHQTMRLNFPAGIYQIYGQEHIAEQIVLECDPYELRARAHYLYEKTPFWISLRSSFPSLSSGDLSLSVNENAQQSLVVKWKQDPQEGILIQNIEGQCAGVSVKLMPAAESKNEHICLAGDVVVDTAAIAGILPEKTRRMLEKWKISGKCLLSGNWEMKRRGFASWSEQISYSGGIHARNFMVKGYQCETLMARVEATSSAIHLKDVRLQDLAGTLLAETMDFTPNSIAECHVKIPTLSISEFRPSLLRVVGVLPEPSESTFLIRQLNMDQFSGNLFEPKTFLAEGRAYCLNPPKRDQPNAVWTIPTDILSGVGLDLSVLSPVAGTIHFRIENEKIYLTKFKDMYSAGRLSKFSLFKKGSTPSHIDFDGNVFVQVRMKQSSLLFKLAELFTVTIQGTLQNPTYSILKHDEKLTDKQIEDDL